MQRKEVPTNNLLPISKLYQARQRLLTGITQLWLKTVLQPSLPTGSSPVPRHWTYESVDVQLPEDETAVLPRLQQRAYTHNLPEAGTPFTQIFASQPESSLTHDLPQLRDLIDIQFNLSELRDLCLQLNIEYEHVPGETRRDKARELSLYCQRHGRLDSLVETIQWLRPQSAQQIQWDWPAWYILGEGGIGKTTILLELADFLSQQAQNNPNHPLPLVLSLAEWHTDYTSLEEMVVSRLSSPNGYGIPQEIAQHWLETNQLMLLLDDFDAVPAAAQHSCLQAIQQFRHNQPQTGLVLCGRLDSYQALGEQPQEMQLVRLQPFTADQVTAYLQQTNEALHQRVTADAVLHEALRLPLMLRMTLIAYPTSSDIPDSDDNFQQQIFTHYVLRLLHLNRLDRELPLPLSALPTSVKEFTPADTQHSLCWLARVLFQQKRQQFLVEEIQPEWLTGSKTRHLYLLLTRLIPGLLLGICLALIGLTIGAAGIVPLPGWLLAISGVGAGIFGGIFATATEYLYPQRHNSGIGLPQWGKRLLFTFGIWQVVGIAFTVIIFGWLFWHGDLQAAFSADIDPLLRQSIVNAMLTGPLIGLLWGIVAWVLLGTIYDRHHFVADQEADIQPVERLSWQWRSAFKQVGLQFLAGFLVGILITLYMGSIWFVVTLAVASIWQEPLPWQNGVAWLQALPFIGLALGFINGIVSGLINGLRSTPRTLSEKEQRWQINQGIRDSAHNAGLVGIIFFIGGVLVGMVIAVLANWIDQAVANDVSRLLLLYSLVWGVTFAVTGSLTYGGYACIQHGVVRLLLSWQSAIPWKLEAFLVEATNRLLLERRGGVFRFRDKLLADYFRNS